jgi:6-phosphogluconolactonase (cycloisomerase 2 family)
VAIRINMIDVVKPALFAGLGLLGFISGSTAAQAQVTCAYVNDNLPTGNSVEGYKIGTKSATHVGPVGTRGSGSATNDPTFFGTPLIAIAPGTTHLYASDSVSNDIALFDIDASSCKLTFVANYPAQGSSLFGLGITISPDGKFLYATNSDRQSTLVVLPIHGDGSLGAAVQTVSLPANLSSLAIAPNGKVLIVTQPSARDQVQSYTIDPSSGEVTFASSVTTVAAADGIAIDPHSKFVYVGNGGEGGSSAVQVIEIGQGGSLTYVANVVFNGIDNPAGIAGSSNCLLFSPNGKLLFFTNQRFATVVSLSVDSQTGGLTFIDLINNGEGFVDEPSQMAANAARGLIFTGDFSTGGTPSMGVLQATANGTLKLLGNLALRSKAAATSIAAATF